MILIWNHELLIWQENEKRIFFSPWNHSWQALLAYNIYVKPKVTFREKYSVHGAITAINWQMNKMLSEDTFPMTTQEKEEWDLIWWK